jgi:hypothetical protein
VGVGHVVPESDVEELVATAAPDWEKPFYRLVEKAEVLQRHRARPPKEDADGVVPKGEGALSQG